jgi:hypothetical protein
MDEQHAALCSPPAIYNLDITKGLRSKEVEAEE